jgi:uncharacterized membrane protein
VDTQTCLGNPQEQANKVKEKAFYFKCKLTAHLESASASIVQLRSTALKGTLLLLAKDEI